MQFEATNWPRPTNSDQECGIGFAPIKVALCLQLAQALSNGKSAFAGYNAEPTAAETLLCGIIVKRRLLARWRNSESVQRLDSDKGDPASARKSSGALRPSALPGACRAFAARRAAWIAFEWRA